jgi:hypothetical protein
MIDAHECRYGPMEFACTTDGHSTSRRCMICMEYEYTEDSPRTSECETCALIDDTNATSRRRSW